MGRSWGIHARPPHSGFKMTACVLPKCPFRNKRKRSSRIDFTHRTFAEKGGMLKKARIQKKKVEPYWLYTPDFCWKGGVGWNTHMRTLNNTEWGGGGYMSHTRSLTTQLIETKLAKIILHKISEKWATMLHQFRREIATDIPLHFFSTSCELSFPLSLLFRFVSFQLSLIFWMGGGGGTCNSLGGNA